MEITIVKEYTVFPIYLEEKIEKDGYYIKHRNIYKTVDKILWIFTAVEKVGEIGLSGKSVLTNDLDFAKYVKPFCEKYMELTGQIIDIFVTVYNEI
jgi:hypothetical protein